MSSNPESPEKPAQVQQYQPLSVPGNICRYDQYPAVIVCQHCQATVTTTLIYQNGMLTWGLCWGLAEIGWMFGVCVIPFFMNCTKDVEHRCPYCNRVVGKFRHCC